jgi:hypothetical protein
MNRQTSSNINFSPYFIIHAGGYEARSQNQQPAALCDESHLIKSMVFKELMA